MPAERPAGACPASRSITVGAGRRLHLDAGHGPTTLLFLHGIPSHHIIWREVIAALPPHIRAIAPDLTGFGRLAGAERPSALDLSPAGQARDMFAFLDALGVQRFGIVAHDYGALVACAMLERDAERVSHLALTNTSLRHADWGGSPLNPFNLVRPPLLGELAFELARPWMLKRAYAVYVTERRKLDGPLMDELWAPFEHGFERTLLRLFRARRTDAQQFERWRAALARFEGPAMIAWGPKDPTFTPARAIDIATLLPQADRAVLAGANHFVQIDRPRALAGLLERLADAGECKETPDG